MDWLKAFKLEYKQVWLIISAFLGIIGPGILIIFHFKPELMEKYDVIKILALALALTLPLLIVNAWNMSLYFNHFDDYKDEDAKNSGVLQAASLLNAFVIYVTLFICYHWSLNFKWFLAILAVVEACLFLLGIFVAITLWPSKTAARK